MSVVRTTACVAAVIGGIGASVAAGARHSRGGACVSAIMRDRHDASVSIARSENGEGLAVDVVGGELDALRCTDKMKARFADAFEVRLAGVDSTLPAIAGRYAFVADTLRFTPAYPLARGEAYRVRVTGSEVIADTTIEIASARRGNGTEVSAVYPSADVLPMNLLKLYVHFSAPMRAGEAAAHVRMTDETDGREVRDAFYSSESELWNPSQTRLTLLFDPGRIKRGLRPNQELGLPLRVGRRYRLVIDAAWRDANGDSLHHGFVKRLAVVSPDHVAPRAAMWSLNRPRAQSTDTLVLSFGEPMDAALVERLIVVRDDSGTAVAGRSFVESGEDRWRFVPAAPWSGRNYAVDVGTDLEDIAGNNLRRLFDTDLRDKAAPALERRDRVTLPIALNPPPAP